MITRERFATGMTFDEYVRYVGAPENLAREAGWWLGPQRRDFSGLLRAWCPLWGMGGPSEPGPERVTATGEPAWRGRARSSARPPDATTLR